jgi:hypothetical protein
MSSQHPSVLVAAALLLIALAIAAVPSARGAARHLITGKDIQHSIATVDLKDGSVNSHKILDGHVLARDLTEDNFSGAYDQVTDATVVQGDMLSIPGASTGVLNSLNVWLSGITYQSV